MKFSMNMAILVGNVTKDPELKYTSGGTAVCNFGVATNRSIKRNDKWEDEPPFHRIVCWSKLAEFCAERLVKGNQVTIEGRIDNRSYEQNGEKKYVSEIVADAVYFKQTTETTSKAQTTKSSKNDQSYPEPPDEPMDQNVDASDMPF